MQELKTIPHRLLPFYRYFISRHTVAFLLMAILPVGWALEMNVFPYLTKMLIDGITTYEGSPADVYSVLAKPLLIGASFWGVLLFMWRGLDVVEWYWEPHFQAEVRMAMFDYTQRHSHRYFADNFAGSIANKISDLPRSGWVVLILVLRHFAAIFWGVILSMALMATVHPAFTLIIFLFFAAHMGICLVLARKCDQLSNDHSESRTVLQGKIVDVLSNITNTRLFASHAYEAGYIGSFQRAEFDKHRHLLAYMTKIRILLEVPSFFMIAAILWLLIYGWQHGWITAGDFAFIIALSFSLMMSVWRMGWELPNFFREVGVCKQALTLISRAHEITDARDARPLVVKEGKIEFDHVRFHYVPGRDIFRNKSITIPAGQKVGLVGFSGSGKSTFVNLILRFYDIEGGRILIDGQDIAHVTQDSLRAQVAMIPQDTSLFHRSLMENIRYGNPGATEEDVLAASKEAHCHEFILQLKDKYNSLVGERGIKLSGGQRQRIAIARAILKDAPLLILDEATSSLDSVTERVIQESLQKLMHERTTIVIAHRLSTLLDMDRILVFDKGEIVEDGTHRELLEAGGHYAMLWEMQAGGFLPDEPETAD